MRWQCGMKIAETLQGPMRTNAREKNKENTRKTFFMNLAMPPKRCNKKQDFAERFNAEP